MANVNKKQNNKINIEKKSRSLLVLSESEAFQSGHPLKTLNQIRRFFNENLK